MKTVLWPFIVCVILSFPVLAEIKISEAKARATFAMAQSGAAYFSIINTAEEMDVLVSVSTSDDVAAMVEIHTVNMVDGMMRMQELADGIELMPNELVTLAPGGKHIMLMGLNGPLEEGKSIDLTLNFKNSSSQTISVPVIKM